MPSWVDTHCHLDSASLRLGPGEDWEQASQLSLERARAAGVAGFVAIGVGGIAATQQALHLAEHHDDVWCTLGVHPHDAGTATSDEEELLRGWLPRSRVKAVGEVGLDYHYDHSPRHSQRECFARWIAIARQAQLPLVVHTREAAEDTLELLASEGAGEVGGLIHCFSEDLSFARVALDLGFSLSFSGIVTFRSAVSVQEVAKWVPLDRMVVETDSPYLAPVPHRGRKCEPAMVAATGQFLAGLRGMAPEALAEVTSANAHRVLSLIPAQSAPRMAP
jgi:TatD DNase family protein